MDQTNQTKTLADIAYVNECQTKVDIYKHLQNTVWQGINQYYLKQAMKEEMSADDLQILKDTFNKLFKVVEPIIGNINSD